MIRIEKAAVSDLKTLQEIGRNTFFQTFAASNTKADMKQYLSVNFSLDKLTAELHHPDAHFFIVWDGASAIGYLKLNAGPAQTELHEDDSLEIERIYVLQAYQGRKIGQLLYEQAITIASQMEKSSVWLGVWENNSNAIRFYEKNGFVAFETHIFKMGSDEQTDIMMRKVLAPR